MTENKEDPYSWREWEPLLYYTHLHDSPYKYYVTDDENDELSGIVYKDDEWYAWGYVRYEGGSCMRMQDDAKIIYMHTDTDSHGMVRIVSNTHKLKKGEPLFTNTVSTAPHQDYDCW